MRFPDFQAIEHSDEITGENSEVERTCVVFRVAVTARIPGGGPEARGEELDLRVPAVAVAADAVQEEDERAFARERDGELRRRADEDGLQGYSALAPEIFTARARFSESFFK